MPTTSNFGWTTPADTDLVKDGAAAIRTLGNGIDTSFLDLKGGTSGQVLSKASNTDLDFTWVAQDDSNAIQNAIVDAKGDLISATAADTPARLAVGANGTVLTADSAEATGLKWATPAASTPTFVGCKVTKTAVQTISNNTHTVVSFDSEVFDTDGFHDNVTNNSRLTIPTGKGGKYLITFQARFDSNATGVRAFRINKNGTNEYQLLTMPPTNGDRTQVAVSTVLNLVAGDYVYAEVFQTSGGNLNIDYTEQTVAFGCSLLGA